MHSSLNHPSVPPGEKERLSELLRRTLRRLDLVDRNDPLAESIAKTIIELDRLGVRDPEEIASRVLKAFGLQDRRVTDAK
jgi:hypothetical protein